MTDVERWEAESIHDPRFILSISWRPVEMDVRKLIDLELSANSIAAHVPEAATELANPLMRAAKPAAKTKARPDPWGKLSEDHAVQIPIHVSRGPRAAAAR